MSSLDPYSPPASVAAEPVYPVAAPLSVMGILFSFRGRIPRRTYWLWTLLTTVPVLIAVGVLESVMDKHSGNEGILPVLVMVLYIPLLWISLALQVKRWHDRDKSGAWVLIAFVPFVGGIWSFIETGCLRGTHGLNQYGEDPT